MSDEAPKYDRLQRQIFVGDVVVYTRRNELKIGTIERFTKKMLVIAPKKKPISSRRRGPTIRVYPQDTVSVEHANVQKYTNNTEYQDRIIMVVDSIVSRVKNGDTATQAVFHRTMYTLGQMIVNSDDENAALMLAQVARLKDIRPTLELRWEQEKMLEVLAK